ncbi:MAG: ATPase [Betaproteobacteria bacterium]|nr:ATPase [Betaproteobacteria bacterium]NBS46424.1 ATPase [Betaproteobacteria bacterium]
MTRRIAILGAESTGKTTLAQALAAHWQGRGQRVHLVGEYLREFCDREQRTPHPHEQWQIAQTQTERIEQAPDSDIVIADTTALMTAIYSEWVFGDRSLYPMALQAQARFDVTLVTGLDIAWVADGIQRDSPQVREPVDQLLRQSLEAAGIAYRVVYGQGPQRATQALLAIEAMAAGDALMRSEKRLQAQTRPWRCGRCSDADCEHRLFRDLTDKPY